MSLDLSRLSVGLMGSATAIADASRSAKAIGSGSVDVFATPMMVALMEAAACNSIEQYLPGGSTSLGTHIDVTHEAATPMGMRVRGTAVLTAIDGRALTFTLEARDERGLIGRGTHKRVVVETERFLEKLAQNTSPSKAF